MKLFLATIGFLSKKKIYSILNKTSSCAVSVLFELSRGECPPDMEVLRTVEELHLSTEIEEEIDAALGDMEEERRETFYQYCSCRQELSLTRFCVKIFEKYFAEYDEGKEKRSMRRTTKHKVFSEGN